MTSGAVIAIAMTLNELCTNTTKFGALSVPAGRVDITWTLDPKTQRLHLIWTENVRGSARIGAVSAHDWSRRSASNSRAMCS
jgi:two-component sensor histidine kinase